MATMIIPLVMAIAGALAYALSANPKVAELGAGCCLPQVCLHWRLHLQGRCSRYEQGNHCN